MTPDEDKPINHLVEFRVKGDTDWGTTPILDTLDMDQMKKLARPDFNLTPHTLAQLLANLHQAEVRWNWQGSLQGNYLSPQPRHA